MRISDVAIAGNGECNAVTPGFPCVSSMLSFDGGYAVVYSDGIDQPFRIASFNSNGGKIGEVDLGNDVLNFDVSGTMALFAVDESIYLIDLSSAKVTSSISIDEPVLRIAFFGTKNVCVVTSAGVREITI